ncbi:unnamed protein product [Ceutorhynchus assimilis]|uniref:DUF4371 domain-containing protein n=1 Tax=Ceutorhynchus assimilis TaxID=467358 RepID=A0A9N9MDU9_9CUCU|nr:unnamed protein product [Ceutorhynchus assimilis]
MAAFMCIHNLPFLLLDYLPSFQKSIYPDSEICQEVKIKRKKATQLVVRVLAPYFQKELIQDLKTMAFSVIIDEMTDISIEKSSIIIVRYWKNGSVKERILDLIKVEDTTSEAIFTSLKKIFDEHKIPYTNIIAFASDGASTMMGRISGVQARFREIAPHIYVQVCLCHALHLCSSAATRRLPDVVEQFILDLIVKVNLELQSGSSKFPILLERLTTLYKVILKNYVKHEIVNKEQLIHVNQLNHSRNYVDLNQIYCGAKTEVFIIAESQKGSHNKQDIENFQKHILAFYIEITSQISSRFDFKDKYLIFAANFAPAAVQCDIEAVNTEWQLLGEQNLSSFNNDVAEFWGSVLNMKNALNERMFPNLAKVVELNELLSLNIKPSDINNIYRLGKGKSSPVLIEFISYLKKSELFKNADKLRGLKDTGYAISNDLCEEDRNELKILRQHFKKDKEENKQVKLTGLKLQIDGKIYTAEDLHQTDSDSNTSDTEATEKSEDSTLDGHKTTVPKENRKKKEEKQNPQSTKLGNVA